MPYGTIFSFTEHEAVKAYIKSIIPEGLYVVVYGADAHISFLTNVLGFSSDETSAASKKDFVYFRPLNMDQAMDWLKVSQSDMSAPYLEVWSNGEVASCS